MVFSRFIWTILFTVAAIVVTAALLGIYIQRPEYPITGSVIVVLLLVESGFLVWYLVRIRRDLLRLILALRNNDPTLRFSEDGEDPYFSAIHRGFNEIIRNFKLVRLDREAEHRFFETTINHIQFGIVAFDRTGRVDLVNDSFLKLFQIKEFTEVDSLEAISPGLPDWMRQVSHDTESFKKIIVNGRPHHLIFLSSEFRLKDKEIVLVSVRDISREIDKNELEAWQKLMRVLRHEILNSISPIKLLAGNMSEMLIQDMDNQGMKDMKTGLETIHRRATGLSNFLDTYSNLYRVPELEMKEVNTYELLNRIWRLYEDQFKKLNIQCSVQVVDKSLTALMDEQMIEQVLINLVKNAIKAVEKTGEPTIILESWQSADEDFLTVTDNGSGIPVDQLDHIFIPFYSTKEEGTGVGLSFAQHIMRLHQGRIHVKSNPGKGSEFLLAFRKG